MKKRGSRHPNDTAPHRIKVRKDENQRDEQKKLKQLEVEAALNQQRLKRANALSCVTATDNAATDLVQGGCIPTRERATPSSDEKNSVRLHGLVYDMKKHRYFKTDPLRGNRNPRNLDLTGSADKIFSRESDSFINNIFERQTNVHKCKDKFLTTIARNLYLLKSHTYKIPNIDLDHHHTFGSARSCGNSLHLNDTLDFVQVVPSYGLIKKLRWNPRHDSKLIGISYHEDSNSFFSCLKFESGRESKVVESVKINKKELLRAIEWSFDAESILLGTGGGAKQHITQSPTKF